MAGVRGVKDAGDDVGDEDAGFPAGLPMVLDADDGEVVAAEDNERKRAGGGLSDKAGAGVDATLVGMVREKDRGGFGRAGCGGAS